MKPFLRQGLRYPRLWICVGLLIPAFITWTCLMPARDVPDIGISDKVIHGFSYAVFAFWFAAILQRGKYLGLFLALTAFGGLIELAQEAMHLGRHAELADLAADMVGAALGIVLAMPLRRWPERVESMFVRLLA